VGKRASLLAVIGPGVLVAATGVGAGDLAGGALAGSILGLACLWAVLAGSAAKLLLTENLARWQIARGTTFLEGAVGRFGTPLVVLLIAYLLPWTLFTCAALISALGVTAHALFPLAGERVLQLGASPGSILKHEVSLGRLMLGIAGSLLALVLVRVGGFRLFERVMGVCVAVMVLVVVTCALLLAPPLGDLLSGLFIPTIPVAGEHTGDAPSGLTGLLWTIALMGGVGGTLTILCYSYWMREAGREKPEHLFLCRLDATLGYAMTAIFGIAMVVIGRRVAIDPGGSAGVLLRVGDELGSALGPPARWAFIVGAFCAVFSSVLGVWQAVPYLYADLWRMRSRAQIADLTQTPVYRRVMLVMATVPAAALLLDFAQVQKAYTVFGAFFVPALAMTQILLNRTLDRPYRNGLLMTLGLAIVVLVGLAMAGVTILRVVGLV